MIAISAKSCFRRNWPEVSIMSIFVHFDAVSPRCTAIKQCYGNQSEIVSGRKETPNVTSKPFLFPHPKNMSLPQDQQHFHSQLPIRTKFCNVGPSCSSKCLQSSPQEGFVHGCSCCDQTEASGGGRDIYNYTSSTAQGGGGSFKNRKLIGEIGCCESGMAEGSHWRTERCLISLSLSFSLSLFFFLFLYLSLIIYLQTYWSICLPICLSVYLSTYLSIYLSIYLPNYLPI